MSNTAVSIHAQRDVSGYLTAFKALGILSDAEMCHACNKEGSFLKLHLLTFKLHLSLFKMTFTCKGMSMHAAAYVCGGSQDNEGELVLSLHPGD